MYKSTDIKRFLTKTYNLEIQSLVRLNQGMANTNYLVNKSYIFKIYSVRTVKQLSFELEVLKQLKRKRFPSPRVVKNNKGKLYSVYHRRPCAVFEYIKGKMLKKATPSSLKEVGKQTAKLHKLLKNKQQKVSRVKWDFVDVKKALKKERKGIIKKRFPQAKERLDFLQQELNKIKLPNSLVKGFTHQDIKPDNIVISKSGKMSFIDFDNSYRGVLLIDLMTTVIWTCFKNNKLYKPYFNAYLKGYNSQRKLTVQENKYIYEVLKFRVLREILIWMWLYNDSRARKHVNYLIRIYKNI